jgi:hypothetical protein
VWRNSHPTIAATSESAEAMLNACQRTRLRAWIFFLAMVVCEGAPDRRYNTPMSEDISETLKTTNDILSTLNATIGDLCLLVGASLDLARRIEAFRQSTARVESASVLVDTELFKTAQEITGVEQAEALVSLALRTLIERESARRLAALGGTMPDFPQIPRRRSVRRKPSKRGD